jgi:cytochrome c oxidase subunit 3
LQQRESAKIGMWLFLLTEILTFGGLFVTYGIFRMVNPEMFYNAHKALDIGLGTFNTIVLIISSVTEVLAIHSIQNDRRERTIFYLVLTILLAVTFLVVKYFEYHHKFELGQLPGKYYTYDGIAGTNPHVFFSIYFLMTGLHGLHVLIGIGLITWIVVRTAKDHFSSDYYTPLENVGLFWHLVDMIWIFLFPLFYLIG